MNDEKNLKKMHLEQMKYLPICLLLAFVSTVSAQVVDSTFAAEIEKHRKHYKEEFISEPRSPLTVKDTAFLDFYPANKGWKVAARFTSTPGAESFDMPTYSGRTAQYRQFGTLQFEKDGASFTMSIYQNLRLLQMPEYKDYLFLPFKDPSNGEATYGGGRYIELRFGDLIEKEGQTTLMLDFNKCFNPYCAYSDGYNCPVPPRENHLLVSVEAGEKLFKGEKKH